MIADSLAKSHYDISKPSGSLHPAVLKRYTSTRWDSIKMTKNYFQAINIHDKPFHEVSTVNEDNKHIIDPSSPPRFPNNDSTTHSDQSFIAPISIKNLEDMRLDVSVSVSNNPVVVTPKPHSGHQIHDLCQSSIDPNNFYSALPEKGLSGGIKIYEEEKKEYLKVGRMVNICSICKEKLIKSPNIERDCGHKAHIECMQKKNNKCNLCVMVFKQKLLKNL